MNIKSDPEVVQRWHTHHWIGNFEADLSMMVSRPYEANLGREKPKYIFSKFAKMFPVENWSKIGRDRVETGSRTDSHGSRELNRRPGRPGEGQGGPNKGHLDPTIGKK